jgi:hypothetical protein
MYCCRSRYRKKGGGRRREKDMKTQLNKEWNEVKLLGLIILNNSVV